MATQALMAQQGAINVTANNIANVNTPGYSRQALQLAEGAPIREGNLIYGNGVNLTGVQSVRDRLLDLRIQQDSQEQGYTDAQVAALEQVQLLFSSTTSGIGAKLSDFFNSLQKLSTGVTTPANRDAVLTAAQNLATSFHDTVTKLSDIQTNLNLEVTQGVNRINELMQQIAALNKQVSQVEAAGNEPGILVDQRTELMRQLAEIIDVTDVQTDQGDTLMTANGMGLVVGSKSFSLDVQTDASGITHVYSQGQDITSSLRKGQLGGNIEVRDNVIPGLISKVNELAMDLKSAFNTQHTAGADLSGAQGKDFFSGVDAATFNVGTDITDSSKIATSANDANKAAGDTRNLTELIALRNKGLATSGKTPEAFFSGLVFNVGNITSQAKSDQSTAELSLNQLQDQRNAISGVSISEETANLMRYQHAFQAAARVISTVDQLSQTVLRIGVS
jgi:flagellar hook-associated protein 1 FlgK